MDWVDRPQNYKDLYGILQLLQSSHLGNFPLKTLKGALSQEFCCFQFHLLLKSLPCTFTHSQYAQMD